MTEIPMPSNPSLWRRVTAGYAKLLEIMLAACVGILVIPVTLQVISRYTPFIPSYIWTEEMARFLFVWTIMIGAMVGVRRRSILKSMCGRTCRGGAKLRCGSWHALASWRWRWCSCGLASSSRGLPGTEPRSWPTCRSGSFTSHGRWQPLHGSCLRANRLSMRRDPVRDEAMSGGNVLSAGQAALVLFGVSLDC